MLRVEWFLELHTYYVGYREFGDLDPLYIHTLHTHAGGVTLLYVGSVHSDGLRCVLEFECLVLTDGGPLFGGALAKDSVTHSNVDLT